MAWSKIQDNSRRASTGASTSSFARKIGSLKTTFSRSEALEKSPPSSALLTQQSCFGCENMASSAGQFLRLGRQSIGGLLGPITQCGTDWVNSTRIGGAASPLNVKRSTRAKSGSLHAVKCGSETRRHASGAALFTTQTPASRSTSITSHPSRSRNSEQRHRTCCSFASLVTNGFIQEGM